MCIRSSYDSEEPMHVILDGPPASAKCMFLIQMQRKLEDVYFVDCTNASGPGMIDYLLKNDVKYLLLDEVEKMSKADQNVLLNVMETGMLTSTKVRKTGSKKTNLSIYATTNDIGGISKPFRSRFMEFSLPPYSYDEFCEIAVNLLEKRYRHPEELSLKVADIVWNKLESKDVRDILTIGKLSNNVNDVDFIATTLQKYKRRNEV
jgi:holliday junction DNA helicase RuvB